MLTATGELRLGDSRLRACVMLERSFRAHLMFRDRIVFDTSCTPAEPSSAPIASILLVHAGQLELAGAAVPTPAALVAAATEFERVQPGAPSLRSWGEPAVLLEFRVRQAHLRVPIGLTHGPRRLPEAVWQGVEAVAEAVAVDQAPSATVRTLLAALVDAGVLAAEATPIIEEEPEAVRRVWAVLAKRYERLSTQVTLRELTRETGRSLRQLHRDVGEIVGDFGQLGTGVRDVLKALRLRTAVLLLSCPEATVGEVADAVGYGSVEAMGRAFRDGRLPPPTEIRERVRYRG